MKDNMSRHDMKTLPALLALCTVSTGGVPTQRTNNVGFEDLVDFNLI